jgi:hypothetical protein
MSVSSHLHKSLDMRHFTLRITPPFLSTLPEPA